MKERIYAENFDLNDSFYIENSNAENIFSTEAIEKLDDLHDLGKENYIFAGYFCYDYSSRIENIKIKRSNFPEYEFLVFHKKSVKKFRKLIIETEDFDVSSIILPEKEKFIKNVIKAKEYIESGEIFQVVLSHRIEFTLKGSKFSFFIKMKNLSKYPFNYYYRSGKVKIFGTSPEILLIIKGKRLMTNPIAGTDGEGSFNNLLKNEKELAEHNMLVDLARNDLGRVSKPGSVKVKNYLSMKNYGKIFHLVSEVVSLKDNDKNNLDAFNAVFPAGTVTGAPKIRSMEIIENLEEKPRGPYAGSFGIIKENDWNMNIIIRSVVCYGDHCYIQAGAGIVFDSIPEKEYNETLLKMKSALGGLLI